MNRSRSPLLGLLLSLALPVSAGCYDTPQPQCAFLCGTGGACPDGYTCAADGWCKRNDVPPEFICEPGASIDASTVDAASADAPVADASLIDASDVDAASIDAATPDAAPPDSAPPDSAPPDSAPPDSTPPDSAPPPDGPTSG